MTLRWLVTAAVVAVLVVLAAEGGSQDVPRSAAQESVDADLEARTTAIASTLRCPVCQGESIQDSPADLAQDMRALVREQLRAGKTPEEVKAYFVGRYGEWILLEPRMTGLNILLYVFPVILVLGGLAFVVVLVRKWSASQPKPE